MPVYRRGIQSLHIIECNRGIDKESEYSGSHKIPECNCDKTVNRPFVSFNPGCTSTEFHVIPCFKTHKYQGNHLQRTESRSKSHDSCRRTCEIEMMEGTQYASRQKHNGREKHCSSCGGCLQ